MESKRLEIEDVVISYPKKATPNYKLDEIAQAIANMAQEKLNKPVQIGVKKLESFPSDWDLPIYHSQGAACIDLRAIVTEEEGFKILRFNDAKVFNTGLAFDIPDGYTMLIFSRSGHGMHHDIRLSNCTGIIDSDYRGEIKIKLALDRVSYFKVAHGDRIAQAMFLPVPRVNLSEVTELTKSARNESGFGSTGIN